MSNTNNTPAAKHTVKEGIAYQTVGNCITNLYVVLGGKRVYVFGAKAGDEITASQAKRLSQEPKSAQVNDEHVEEPKAADTAAETASEPEKE